jgi:Lytic transglycolase
VARTDPVIVRRRVVALLAVTGVVLAVILLVSTCGSAPLHLRTTVASRFDDYGLPLACGGVLGRDQQGVAHKTLPCGTKVTIVYRGRRATVPVVDRGPYVAGREFDLTGATANTLHFGGVHRVQVHP